MAKAPRTVTYRLTPMTVREVRFCRHLADHGQATRAYRQAGFECDGRSDEAVRKAASHLSHRPDMVALVAQMVQEALDAERTTVARTIQGLAREAFAKRSKLFGPDGGVLPPAEWPEELDALVTGVKVRTRTKDGVTTTEHEVRFASGTSAKRTLAEIQGLIGSKPAADAGPTANRLVVGGESDPESL